MIRDMEEYLSDEQIARCELLFNLHSDEYIHCAYISNGQLYIEILSDLFGEPGELTVYEPDLSGEQGQKKLNYILNGLKPWEECELIGHCCNYGTHDCPDCEKVFNEENN